MCMEKEGQDISPSLYNKEVERVFCHGSGMPYLLAHVVLCHMTARLAWRPLFQSLWLFFFFLL